jgi:hypothetical protein
MLWLYWFLKLAGRSCPDGEKSSELCISRLHRLFMGAPALMRVALEGMSYGVFIFCFSAGAFCGRGASGNLSGYVQKDPSGKVPLWAVASASDRRRTAKNMAISHFRTRSMAGQ